MKATKGIILLRVSILILILLGIFSLCVAILGQNTKSTSNSNKSSPPQRPPEIENLLAEANSIPGEFAADAFIRIAASKKVSDSQWKKEILERAFYLAPSAQQSVRRTVIPALSPSADTSSGYLSYAFDRRLDALSLRSRALKEMLKIDKQRARELLEEISPKLPLPPLSCEDALAYDVSEYYEVLGEIARNTFSEEEMKQGEHISFVQRYIGAVSSPAQIAPVINVILSLNTRPEELTLLVQDLIKAIGHITADDRSFTYSVSSGDLTRGIYRLKQVLEEKEVPLSQSLISAYRDYLLKNMSGTRCAENAVTDKDRLPRYIKQLNDGLFSTNPFTFDEIKQREVSGKANVDAYWVTSEAQRLLYQIKDLRFRPTQETSDGSKKEDQQVSKAEAKDYRTITEAEKKSLEWQLKFSQFLTDLEGWNCENEKSKLYCFHQKQVLYRGLFDIAPRNTMRTEVLRSWVNSLRDQRVEDLSRMEWYLYVYYLTEAERKLPPEAGNEVLDLMIDSNNPALSVYGKLAKL